MEDGWVRCGPHPPEGVIRLISEARTREAAVDGKFLYAWFDRKAGGGRMKFRQNLKFGTSGVRGIVGESLTPRLTAALAAAFGRYVGGGRVLVGRDTRPSGEMF